MSDLSHAVLERRLQRVLAVVPPQGSDGLTRGELFARLSEGSPLVLTRHLRALIARGLVTFDDDGERFSRRYFRAAPGASR